MTLAWIADSLPLVLPASWRIVEARPDGIKYTQAATGLTVIVSGARELDERRWLHMSLAHPERLPSWNELRDTKRWVLGARVKAVMVLPEETEYVNIHPFCLHLFASIDGNPLPDFTRGSGSL